MSVQVDRFEGSAAEWDEFVRRQTGWTHCHLFGWQGVISATLGHQCLYLAARNDRGELAGILPLVRVKSLLFGHYLVSMPFLNYGGPLGGEEAVLALSARAAQIAATDGVKLLELRSRIQLPVSLAVSHRKITVLLDLPSGQPEQLWKQLDAKLRSQVRRPQKEGVTVRFGLDQVDPFFEVFSQHMRDLGTPTMPSSFFEEIARVFPDSAWFGCAYLNETPIACGAGFQWDREFEMTWASALSAHNRIAPNMLLYWSFMERAAREGLGVFNFGRCTPGGGTHRFKSQWGSRDEQLSWYQQARGKASTPSPTDGAYAWGPRLWRRLPMAVANRLGPRIVRFIP